MASTTQLKRDTSMEKEEEEQIDPEMLELLEKLGIQDKDKDELLAAVDIHIENGIRAKEAADKRTEDPLKNWIRPHNEECPICLLPLPVDGGIIYRQCCDSRLCKGCMHDHILSLLKEGMEEEKVKKAVSTCALCRQDPREDAVDMFGLQKKLAKAGKLEAMYELAMTYIHGENGVDIDWDEGLKWMQRAAVEGFGNASHFLGNCYRCGQNNIERNINLAIEYYKQGGDNGSVQSYACAGEALFQKGEIEYAMLYFRKAAMCGLSNEDLFTQLRDGFGGGYITKDEYANTLLEHQKVSNEMKSESRTMALRLDMFKGRR